MTGELRTLLSRGFGPSPIGWEGPPPVFFSATLDHYQNDIFDVLLKEGDVCIVLCRHDKLLYVLTSGGTGFVEVLDTKAVYGSYGKLYTCQG